MVSRSSTDGERKAPRCPRRAAAGLVLLASLFASPTARAGANEDADEALRRGVALRHEGKDAEALEAFQRALELAPSARARAQVALAEQALALWVVAERNLALALAEEDDAWIKAHREPLEGAARVIASKLAWVTVGVKAPGAEVFVNGSRAPLDPEGRVRVVAGLVTLEVRADGYEPASKALRVAPETTSVARFDLRPLTRPAMAEPARAPRAPEAPSGSAGRTTGWILAGVGGAGVGVGAAFGLRALSKKNERDADCTGGCTQIGVDADRAGRQAGLVSTIATVGGLVATGAGVWLILRAGPPQRASSVGVHVAGSSIRLEGSF